ncbi:MAG TPA: mechanosensitive ion channel family protein [Sporichthyaceae bacterium]|jgi:small conductance mechanosensitive channel
MATPAPAPLLASNDVPCYLQARDSLCKQVHEWTGSKWLSESSDWVIAKPARILLIFLIALLVRVALHRAITRLCERAAHGTVPAVLHHGHNPDDSVLATERRAQRSATIASVLRSITTGLVFTIALFMALSELTLNIGPLIASAGIIGVAIGFGSQALVKDFLSGVFMILEDQYGVGDDVDLGEARGIVEAVGLRVTRIRDVEGTVWYVANGEIKRVGNRSHGWARSVIDLDIAYGEDIPRVRELLTAAGQEAMAHPEVGEFILEPPAVWGVQALSADAVVMRMVVKTQPGMQFKVARATREIIKKTMDAHGVEIPFPQRTVWVRSEGRADLETVGAQAGGGAD